MPCNEPPSFQGNSVDVCRQSCIKGEGDPEVFKLFNIVQDSHCQTGMKEVGVGFLENSR